MNRREAESLSARALDGTILDPEIGPIDGTIQEQANLISRGVRPLALLGHVRPDPITMLRAYNRLEHLAPRGGASAHEPIPIVMLRKDGSCADAGFAARQWVAETFKWVSDNAPQPHLNHLIGLMLGYSPDAIAALDEVESGALFPDTITALRELEPNSPHDRLVDTEGTSHPG